MKFPVLHKQDLIASSWTMILIKAEPELKINKNEYHWVVNNKQKLLAGGPQANCKQQKDFVGTTQTFLTGMCYQDIKVRHFIFKIPMYSVYWKIGKFGPMRSFSYKVTKVS